jgi:hypothetical protein
MIKPCTILFPFLLATSNTAFAQVYQSTDADGNTVFGDTPTPNSQEIQIPETNLGDAVEVPKSEPKPEPQPEPEVIVEEVPDYLTGEISVKTSDDDDDNKRRRRRKPSPH